MVFNFWQMYIIEYRATFGKDRVTSDRESLRYPRSYLDLDPLYLCRCFWFYSNSSLFMQKASVPKVIELHYNHRLQCGECPSKKNHIAYHWILALELQQLQDWWYSLSYHYIVIQCCNCRQWFGKRIWVAGICSFSICRTCWLPIT